MAISFEAALAYSEQWPFRKQCGAAGLKIAFEVLDEATSVTNHTERLAMAYAVISNPLDWCQRLATACVGAADSFPAATPTDATVLAVIGAIWTKLALAYAATKAV